ncbi:MAG: DUF805 domain-containing protein [Planctomycetota bacterium]|jgi:uncharacterized membrane protein YhaH (DUF805 family)
MNIQPEQIREKPFFNIDHLIFLFFSYKGRVNRKRYLLSGLLLTPVYFLVELLSDVWPMIALVLCILMGFMGLMVSIKRAHDRNRSGHFCWLLLVPILWFWPGIELMFFKGTSGDNRFGPDMLPPKDGGEHTTERADEDTRKHIEVRAWSEVKGAGYLGIYLGNNSATVVCTDSQGRGKNVLGCFSVSVEGQEQPSVSAAVPELARLIAEGCAQRELNYSEVAVALDCAMFMQHEIRNEFKEPKQIAQTVRFDTEEALSTDISDVAVAFKIASVGPGGSELAVFTAQREVLSNILVSLQSNNIDPVTVEPDVNCLARFALQKMSPPEDSRFLFGMLSSRNGYLVGSGKSPDAPFVRTFLVGRTQDRTNLLARQIPLTIGLLGGDGQIGTVGVFDYAGTVSSHQLREKLGLEVAEIDLVGSAGAGPEQLADCANPVDFAIAFGAALAHSEKVQTVNFRNDFMPYQGKRRRVEKALKALSVSVGILMVALGIYVTAQLLQTNKYRGRLRSNFAPDYSAVMSGQRPRGSIKESLRKLSSLSRRIKSEQNPMLADESPSSRLRLILEAFNKCAKKTRLNIDQINITSKTVRITGDTSNRQNTLRLRQAIAQSNLGSLHETIESTKSGRAGFRITIELGKQ